MAEKRTFTPCTIVLRLTLALVCVTVLAGCGPGENGAGAYESETPASEEIGGAAPAASEDVDFTGEWSSEDLDDGTFTLSLHQQGDRITGDYVAVARGGERIDVPSDDDPPPIEGVVEDGMAKVTFTSGYSGAAGEATISFEGGKLAWVIVEDDGGEHYLPQKTTMNRAE